MQLLKKDSSSETGQVIILYAIFILFLVVIGIAAIDIGKVIMFKTKLRTSVDQAVLAAQVAEKESLPILYQVRLDQSSTYARFILHTGVMLQNYQSAADLLLQYTNSHDDVANWFYSTAGSYIDQYANLSDYILEIPSSMEYHDSDFCDLEVTGFSDSLGEKLYSFMELEKMILYKEMLDLHIQNSTQEWQNVDTLFIPVASILNESPIEGTDISSISFRTDELDGDIMSICSIDEGGNDLSCRNAFLVFQIVNTPDLIVGDTVATQFGKMGKVAMMSIGSSELPEAEFLPEEWLSVYEPLFHETNIQGQEIVQEMIDYENERPGHAYGLRKNHVKEKWNELEQLYDNFFNELDSFDELNMMTIQQLYHNAYPLLISVDNLFSPDNPDLLTLGSSQGYDLTDPTQREEFFAQVSLEDFFSSEENFYLSVEDSIQSFDDSIKDLAEDYDEYIDFIQPYAVDLNPSSSNLSTVLHSIVDSLDSNTSLTQDAHLCLFMDRFADILLDQHTNALNFQILVTHREEYDYTSLKPYPRVADFVSRYFDEPMMEWVQN
ncbi:MAG TPA: Tad domain-containing protein [Caldisericia bacterium]|nr:Tad domain-containing protein [Caldisericia bacterium]